MSGLLSRSRQEARGAPAPLPSDALHAKCEELEPAVRALGADAAAILAADAATCLQVSDKLLALGTASGIVHLLDYDGNQARRCKRFAHMAS